MRGTARGSDKPEGLVQIEGRLNQEGWLSWESVAVTWRRSLVRSHHPPYKRRREVDQRVFVKVETKIAGSDFPSTTSMVLTAGQYVELKLLFDKFRKQRIADAARPNVPNSTDPPWRGFPKNLDELMFNEKTTETDRR